jgi:hypothetical protein
MPESPTLEGFRATLRLPSLTLAEVCWRWSAGALAVALSCFSIFEFLDTLPVGNADLALLSTRQPALMGRALAHILRGSLNRAVVAAFIAILASCILWIVACSIGRFASLLAMRGVFHRVSGVGVPTPAQQPAEPAVPEETASGRPMRSLIDLNILRVAVMLATLLSLVGAALLASFVSSPANPRPGVAVLLFCPFAGFVLLAGWSLNWWLSLAAIFAVRDGAGALEAISAAVTLARERAAAVLAVSTWTGLAHLVAFSIATTAVSFPLAFLRIFPPRLITGCVVVIGLAYFAVADWLYVARLAGYVHIVLIPAEPIEVANVPSVPWVATRGRIATTIDTQELILSDLPGLAT